MLEALIFTAGLMLGLAIGYGLATYIQAEYPKPPKHQHEWSPWKQAEGTLTNNLTGRVRETMVQIRTCETCNKMHVEKIGT